jgi:hypothetical protein
MGGLLPAWGDFSPHESQWEAEFSSIGAKEARALSLLPWSQSVDVWPPFVLAVSPALPSVWGAASTLSLSLNINCSVFYFSPIIYI